VKAAMPVVLILIFVAVVAVSFSWSASRGSSILEKWAAENGYRLLAAEKRFLRLGPFFLRCGKGQVVYYFTIALSDGTTRSGYARCGGWFLGLMSDAIKVEWDDGAPG